MIIKKIESERLFYKPIEEHDILELFKIQNDPHNFKYTNWTNDFEKYKHKVETHESTRSKNNIAPWAVILKEQSKIIGWGGLYEDPFDLGWGIEVAYFLQNDYWGKGFASELVCNSLSIAFRTLCLEKVVAFAHPGNTASNKVLQKNNFQFDKFLKDINRNFYTISNDIWQSSNSIANPVIHKD